MLEIDDKNYYTISDMRLLSAFGSGDTKKDAIKDYRKSLKKEKEKRLKDLKNIEILEKEIEALMKLEISE